MDEQAASSQWCPRCLRAVGEAARCEALGTAVSAAIVASAGGELPRLAWRWLSRRGPWWWPERFENACGPPDLTLR